MELLALEYPAIVAAPRDGDRDPARRGARAGARALGGRRGGGAPAGADHRGDRALRALGGAAAGRDPRRARGGRAGGARRRRSPAESASARVAATIHGAAPWRGGAITRRCSASSRRRSSRRWRRSPSRSTARSSPTAPACATRPRPSCGGCASELRDHQQRAAEELRRLARSVGAARPPAGGLRRPARRAARLRRARERARQRAGDRPRRLGLRPDGVHRAARARGDVEQGTPRWRAPSARRCCGSCASCRALVGARADAVVALVEATARDRPRGRARVVSRALARRRGDGLRRGAAARGAAPAARPEDGRADRPRARRRCARS